MEKILVENVFIDLEGTITDDVSKNEFISDPELKGDSFGGILRKLLVQKFKISPSEALTEIKEITKPCGWIDPFYAVSHSNWGISEEEIWKEILKWQNEHLIIFKDAVDMIKKLDKKNFNLYMVSNCAKKVVLAQLNTAKLANKFNSRYFKNIYGCFDLGFQKNNPLVFKKILKIESLEPDKTVMIGNEPSIDLESPHKAGIIHSIIVDRTQLDMVKIKNKDIFVKNLQIVPKILQKDTFYTNLHSKL